MADLVADLKAQIADLKEEEAAGWSLARRQADILTGVVNALRGAPPRNMTWSHHDAVELAENVMALQTSLKNRVAEYVEQAHLGLLTEHESCPAVFACGFIVADNAGQLDHESWCKKHQEWHGDCELEEIDGDGTRPR